MNKTPTTSIQAFFKHLFTVCLIGVVYILTQALLFPILTKLHDYLLVNDLMLWFGGMISLIVFYLIYWIWAHKETYLPSSILPGLLLIAVLYLYYRLFSPSCHFWLIDAGYPVAWADLFLLPWLYILLRYVKIRCTREEKDETKVPSSQILNRAIESAKEDELDFKPKVDELVQELKELDLREQSTCYGIIAPWGYGKTSFLNLLSDEFRSAGDGIIVWFNPRSAKSAERIQEDFFAKLGKELSRYYWGAGLIISRYAKHLGLLDHYSETRLIADALRLLQTKGSKETVSNAIEKTGKRLYIILDDLDRLTGAELLETIKLIDLNASFKNTVFLVACDKKYANDVLQAHLGSNPGQGYLDKYITEEVPLSKYIEEKLNQIMIGYLREYVKDGILVRQKAVLENWHDIAPYIIPHLGTCRQLKQYFRLFINDFREVQDYVDPVDFFLLTLLKYKDKGVYDAVKYRIYFGGGDPFFSCYSTGRWDNESPLLLFEMENNISSKTNNTSCASKAEDFHRSLIEQLELVLQAAQWDGAAAVLWMLFPDSKMADGIHLPFDLKDGYERKSNVPYSSIRYRRGFTSYFPDLVDIDRELWHQDVLSIAKCKDRNTIYQLLDRRYNEKDADALVHLLLDLLESHLQPDENWIRTLHLVIYTAGTYDDLELKRSLPKYLRKRNKFSAGMPDDVIVENQYRMIMDEILNNVIDNYPLLAYELLAPIGNPSIQGHRIRYIYTEKEAAELLLKAFEKSLTKYAGQQVYRHRDIINELLREGSFFMLKKEASLQFSSWIKTYPREGVWMLLSTQRVKENSTLEVGFESTINAIEEAGLSVETWISIIEDSKTKEVLEVVASKLDRCVSCLDFKHDNSISIPYIHEAFTRSGLIPIKQ